MGAFRPQAFSKTLIIAGLALGAAACETYPVNPLKLVRGELYAPIEVLAPAGGEQLCADRSYPLTWRNGNPRKDIVVSLIRYSDNAPDGAIVENSAPEPRPNNGTTIFTIGAFDEPGQFAFSIAHEGKKPLGGVSGKFDIQDCSTGPDNTGNETG